MRALALVAHGGPEVAQLLELPDPVLPIDGAIIRVKACALNHLDLWVRRGWPALRLTFPHIQGSDIAGVVEHVADGVIAVKPGDRVLVSPGTSCGNCAACGSGNDSLCAKYHLRGETMAGGACERVAAAANDLLRLPDSLSFEEAAATSLTFLTAWHMLVARAHLARGEWILVQAAGSGVGSAAIQVARYLGAQIIATAGDDAKLDRAKALGAAHAINYRTADFLSEVRRITAKRGVDVVFESVGGETFEKSVRALAPGGRLVTCGATSGAEAKIDLRVLFWKQLSLLGSTMGGKRELAEVLRLAGAGHFKAVIDRVFPLEKAREALSALESREVFGKIVLVP